MGSVCPSNPYRNPQYPGANLPAIFVEQFHIELGALLIPAFNRKQHPKYDHSGPPIQDVFNFYQEVITGN